jgi:hypothetical protein
MDSEYRIIGSSRQPRQPGDIQFVTGGILLLVTERSLSVELVISCLLYIAVQRLVGELYQGILLKHEYLIHLTAHSDASTKIWSIADRLSIAVIR